MAGQKKKGVVSTGPYGFAFKLEMGETEYCLNDASAKAFKKNYRDLIVETMKFESKKEFDAHQRVSALSTPVKADGKHAASPNGGVDSDSEAMTDAEKAAFESIKQKIDSNRPACKIEFHYRTTAMANCAVAVIRFRSVDGGDDWRMKTGALHQALLHYVSQVGIKDDAVSGFILGLQLKEQRDLSGSPSKVLVNNWKSPNNNKTISFPYHLLCGKLAIPHTELKSRTEETAYLEAKFNEIGATMKRVMLTKLFACTYEYAIDRPAIWGAIGNSHAVGSYFGTFAKESKVIVERCPCFNTHLVKDEATSLLHVLFENRVKGLKYPTDKVSPADPIYCFFLPGRPHRMTVPELRRKLQRKRDRRVGRRQCFCGGHRARATRKLQKTGVRIKQGDAQQRVLIRRIMSGETNPVPCDSTS